MGLFDHQFPYTNFHDLNLDWILTKLQELETRIDGLQELFTAQMEKYVDMRIDEFVKGPIADMQNEIDQFERDFEKFKQDSANQYKKFSDYVDAQIALMRKDIADATARFEGMIAGANAYTDASIMNAENRIYANLSTELAKIRVLNYFTGEYVTVQEMFDYLAQLHVTDALTYAEIPGRNNTYDDVAGYNATFTQVTINSAVIFEQK